MQSKLTCAVTQVTPTEWHPSKAQMDRAEVMSPAQEPNGVREVFSKNWRKLLTCV